MSFFDGFHLHFIGFYSKIWSRELFKLIPSLTAAAMLLKGE